MTDNNDKSSNEPPSIDRRRVLGAAGSGLVATLLSNVWPATVRAQETPVIRWGIVGTGSIANSMASVIASVPSANLAAVSSRRMSSASAFAAEHGISKTFDSWAEMTAWEGIDAVYVATPTGVREEICIAAAKQGKHVLGEKPFASLDSLGRIVAACRANDVGFMDGTHFGHHPRTAAIRTAMNDAVGWPWSLASTFQFSLPDRRNIRYNPDLEPMGAIGDVGWYNMRAVAEYFVPDLGLRSVSSYLRRDPETRAAVGGSGVLQFEDGSTSTWNCGFDSGAVLTDLRLTGANGVITLGDFPSNDADGSANYILSRGGWEATSEQTIRIASEYTSRQLMFEDFAAMAVNARLRERSIADSVRTQSLLDAVWESALENERS